MENSQCNSPPLRIFCIEDNPLIVLHLEMLIEQLGHIFAGSSDGFTDVQSRIDDFDFDIALVDIDLADGRTGGDVAVWLHSRGCPLIFITGQEQIASTFLEVADGLIVKPVTAERLSRNLDMIHRARIASTH